MKPQDLLDPASLPEDLRWISDHYADTLAGLNELLANLQNELVKRPKILGQELQSQLQQPVTDAVEQLHSIQKALGPVATSFRSVRLQQILATLLTGLTIGIVASVVLFNS